MATDFQKQNCLRRAIFIDASPSLVFYHQHELEGIIALALAFSKNETVCVPGMGMAYNGPGKPPGGWHSCPGKFKK